MAGLAVDVGGAPDVQRPLITAETLGSADFRALHRLRYAYVAGAMYKGIASPQLVIAMGRAGLMGYLGAGGMPLPEIEAALRDIHTALGPDGTYGMNLLCNRDRPEVEERTVEIYLRSGVRDIEAAAFTQITPSLVWFRLSGCRRARDGSLDVPHRIMAKVSHPEVATAFMSPAPDVVVRKLVERGRLTPDEAVLASSIPMSDTICVEADSGGHTDRGVAIVLLPAMLLLRDDVSARHRYRTPIHVGSAGGIGTPHAAAAAFVMGADFILTGSINQCTVEAGTSAAAKDLLQTVNVHDTAYAPAGDMFESGSRIQVIKRGTFFPMRATKLYELYSRHESLEDIDAQTRQQIQSKWFGRTFEEIWNETRTFYLSTRPDVVTDAERNPKRKMALVFKWYFVHSSRLALEGREERRVDFQVHCGPALGAFNQWVKGTELESWRNRRVAVVAEALMSATADLLNARFASWGVKTTSHDACGAIAAAIS